MIRATFLVVLALALVGVAAATAPAAPKVDAVTAAAEVEQLKALLTQIESDHGRKPAEEKVESEAKQVLVNMEEHAAENPTQLKKEEAAEGGAAEESSEASEASTTEESTEESTSEESTSEESSEASEESSADAGKEHLAQLHKELADLLVKKDDAGLGGEELEKLNVEIELVLNKIKAATGHKDKPADGKAEKKERNAVEQVVDPVLAHLTTLREHKGQFAGLHAVDVQDLIVNLRKLADLAAAFAGKTGNATEEAAPATEAPATTTECGQDPCPKKELVEAEEKKCGDSPCQAQQEKPKTVVAKTLCSNTTTTDCVKHNATEAAVKPTTCGEEKTSCAAQAEQKSLTSTCDVCHQKRQECFSACEKKEACVSQCHQEQDKCHENKCGSTVARTDIVKPTTSVGSGPADACQANSAGGCANVKPTTVPKGALSDKKAAFLFL